MGCKWELLDHKINCLYCKWIVNEMQMHFTTYGPNKQVSRKSQLSLVTYWLLLWNKHTLYSTSLYIQTQIDLIRGSIWFIIEWVICWWVGCRTDSPTSTKHRDDLDYIKIWAIPFRRLAFCGGAPSPYNWYQSHADDGQPTKWAQKGTVRSFKASWTLEDLTSHKCVYPVRWRKMRL